MRLEAFDQVVDRHGNRDRGREADQEGAQREHHVVQMVLERRAEDAQPHGHDDQARHPQRVQPILGLPEPAAAATAAAAAVALPPAQPHGQAVVEQDAVDLG